MSQRLSTTVVAECTVFEVLEHRVETSGGAGARAVHTMRMPEWVSVVAVTTEGRFALVRQHRFGVDSETLETAGGLVDPGEDPRASAVRELLEETGYAPGTVESLGWVHPNPALQDNRCHLFLVRDAHLVGAPMNDAHESTEPVILDRPALEQAMQDGTITHALAILSLERAFARLDGGRRPPADAAGREVLRRAFDLLAAMEETQRGKVLELARRLRPGLTAEDIRNPHDFPDLDDPDWHFEDGQLTGIEAVRFALHGLARDLFPDAHEEEGSR